MVIENSHSGLNEILPCSFLFVRDAETRKPKAFVNFRFDLDENLEVLYW